MSNPYFEGTEKDFHNFFGGYSRNLVQSITRKHKKEIKKCEHCGITGVQLDSAHINGKERKIIISNILKNYITENNLLLVPLNEFERVFIEHHQPISDVIKILCKPCHLTYDKVDSFLDFETTSVIQNKDNSVIEELHKVNYFEYARLTFSKSLIDPLNLDDQFSIHVSVTNETFILTKRDFYRTFNNVVTSDSYKIKGIYSYTKIPQKTYKYLSNRKVSNKLNDDSNLQIAKQQIPAMKKVEVIKSIKLKIGKYVQHTFREAFKQGLISNDEIQNLQNPQYSKTNFNANLEVLRLKTSTIKDTNGSTRYYSRELFCGNYYLTSQWIEAQWEFYLKWLKKIGYNKN
jgi:hypothetical protein